MSTVDRLVSPPLRARRGALFVVLWAFGFATTVLLIGLWGRATSNDQETLALSARDALTAEDVSDRLYGWIGDTLVAADGVDAGVVRSALREIESHPEAEAAMRSLVAEAVATLFAAPGESVSVEVTSSLAPLIPVVLAELNERGIDVTEVDVRESLEQVEALGFDTEAVGGILTIAEEVRGFLSWAVVVGLLGLLLTGALAMVLAEDRVGMARTLATRIALSAVSFALLFQIAGWILDPNGGRSAIGAGGSTLVKSNGHVFLLVALGATVAAVATFAMRRRRDRSRPIDGEDDDTRELVSV